MEFTGIHHPGYREFLDGLYWIQECIVRSPTSEQDESDLPSWYDVGHELHGNQNAYLIDGDDSLLFDTLTPASEEHIVETVDRILDGAPLDYLAISHPEANHAGNTVALLERYPDVTVIAPKYGSEHELYHLGNDIQYVGAGDTLDLGQREVSFHQPQFYDHAMHIWMREETTGTLFTVDWLGYQHIGGDCLRCADELTYPVSDDQLIRFNSFAFPWLAFANTEKTDRAVDAVIDQHDPNHIAPAHGQVILEEPAQYLEQMKRVMEQISEQHQLNVRDNLDDIHV